MNGRDDIHTEGGARPQAGLQSAFQKGREDVHAEGGARPQEGQQGPFQWKDEGTHKLRVERGHKKVSRMHFSERMRGPTR